jgi:hypothetical protein
MGDDQTTLIDAATLTPERRFALMLLERVEKLEAESDRLRLEVFRAPVNLSPHARDLHAEFKRLHEDHDSKRIAKEALDMAAKGVPEHVLI